MNIKGYSFNIQAFEDKYIGTILDIFFLNMSDENIEKLENYKFNKPNDTLSILRLYNFEMEFMLHKLPGQTEGEFKEFIENQLEKHTSIKVEYTEELIEAGYFSFGEPHLYAIFKSTSLNKLKMFYNCLLKSVRLYYESIHTKLHSMSSWDKLFLNETESPFRYTKCLNIKEVKYYLSTKYKIPCVGGFEINISEKDKKLIKKGNKLDLSEYSPKIYDENRYEIFTLNCSENRIFKNFKQNPDINGVKYLSIMSYDIETYTQQEDLPEKDKVIMCIGLSMFTLLDQKPVWKKCLSIKDFDTKDLENQNISFDIIPGKSFERKIIVDDENGETEYIIFKDEKSMLLYFVKQLILYKPTFFNGFNSFGFDNPYVESRIKLYKKECPELNIYMMQAYSCYDYEDLIAKFNSLNDNKKRFWDYKHLIPEYKDMIGIKFDGEINTNNAFWIGTSTISTDTYKFMLMANAKLFSQEGRGNLDTMLEVKKVKNPFTGKPLSKTGLSYAEMYDRWDNNYDIYSVLKYCMFDAFICTSLLIKTMDIYDKIEMANLVNINIYDTMFRAVTTKVENIIREYAYKNNFAVMDAIVPNQRE